MKDKIKRYKYQINNKSFTLDSSLSRCFQCLYIWNIPRSVKNIRRCPNCRRIDWSVAPDKKIYLIVSKWASNIIGEAKKRKIILSPRRYNCVDCKKTASLWEHRDYSLPLKIEPVCVGCNKKRSHAKNYSLLKKKKVVSSVYLNGVSKIIPIRFRPEDLSILDSKRKNLSRSEYIRQLVVKN